MSFKRSMGPIGLMFTAVSGIMGSAWLFGPFYAAKIAGPSALLAWVIGALAMIAIAMTFAELVCMLPISGGNARFMHFSHGALASFLFSWTLYLGYASVAPVETMGVLQYLSSVWPHLIHSDQGVSLLTPVGYVIAAGVLALMCIINFLSIKWLARYNSVVVWFKVLVPILVAACVIVLSFHSHNLTHLKGGFFVDGFNGIAKALSLGGVIFAFAGYAPVIVLAGEAKNPQKVIPLVLVGALVLCLVVYLLLELALVGAMRPENLNHGWAHLHFYQDASPFIGLADKFHLHALRYLIFLTAIIAPLGTAIIFIATSSRVAYAMSQNGYLPELLRFMSKRGVPVVAVCLNFVVGMLLFFPSPGWQGMVGFLVSAFVLCYAIGPICVLALRRNLPNKERPFHLPLASLWSFIAFTIANLIVYWAGWKTDSHLGVAIIIGLVLLLLMRLVRRGWEIRLDVKHAWWVIVYFSGLVVLSYCGNFGGGRHFFPHNWDILIVAIFSLVILLLATTSRLPAERSKALLVS